jgi:hypothetical protein
MIVRIYTGHDGQTHFEDLPLPAEESYNVAVQPGANRVFRYDAKALFQADRHVISRRSRRTGYAELFAGGQAAQQIFLHGWMAGLAPQAHRPRHVPGPAQMAPMPLT